MALEEITVEDTLPRVDRMCEHKDDVFVVTFTKYLNERNEMLAHDKNGNEIIVDPFVGCTWEWEKANELIGKEAVIRGYWSCNRSGYSPFITDEDEGIQLLTAPQ